MEDTMATESEELRSSKHTQDVADRYWKRNLGILFVLLAIWWGVSFGAGIVWAGSLDNITIPGTGFKLGFWISQQGSILVFIALILVYAIIMHKVDMKYHLDVEEPSKKEDNES